MTIGVGGTLHFTSWFPDDVSSDYDFGEPHDQV